MYGRLKPFRYSLPVYTELIKIPNSMTLLPPGADLEAAHRVVLRRQATHKDTEARRMITENEIGKVAVELYSRQDAKNAKPRSSGQRVKTIIFYFIFLNSIFLANLAVLRENFFYSKTRIINGELK
jgi:hypothetical protein